MADTKISALTAATTPLGGTEVLPIVQTGTTVKASIANVQAAPVAAGTANAVQYLDGSKVPSTLSTFAFDGANMGVGTATPDSNSRVHAYKASGNSYIFVESPNDVNTGYRATNNQRAWLHGIFGGVGAEYWFYDLTSGANRLAIGANVTIPDGNLVIGTSGKGIDFSATPGTGTSELLADYEEGTWTPTGFGITFASASGKYTKVGNLVTCTFFAAFPTTADGNIAYITGLPFVAASEGGVGMSYYSNDLNYAVSSGNSYLLPFNEIASGYKTNADLSAVTVGGSFSYQV